MRRRLLGLSSALAVLFIGYGMACVADVLLSGGFSVNTEYESTLIVRTVMTDLVFSAIVLFMIVLPEVLLTRWLVRRFHWRGGYTFVSFLALSSLAAVPLVFVPSSTRLAAYAYLSGMVYLLVASAVLWWISFAHEPVA